MQGKQTEGLSGRAILATQQAGMTEMTPLLDNLRHFNLRVFRAIWNRIRQYWTTERWIRITDDERNVRFVGLNVTQGHLAMQKLGEAYKAGDVDQQTAMQYQQQIHSDPNMMKPANQVAELDVDIHIEEVNDTPTLQIEQFEQLVQLASSGMMQVPPELIIQASQLRDKPKLLKILEEQKQAPNPMQELQVQGAAAGVAKTQAEADLTNAKAQNEAIRPHIEAFQLGMQSEQQPPQAA
jgi:hypothetical protein